MDCSAIRLCCCSHISQLSLSDHIEMISCTTAQSPTTFECHRPDAMRGQYPSQMFARERQLVPVDRAVRRVGVRGAAR